MKQNVVAIDGPSGSGKSTVAQKVAQEVGGLYIDTGAMFRSVAYTYLNNAIDMNTEELSSRAVELLQVDQFHYAPDSNCLVRAYGEDLTEKIRDHEISADRKSVV